MLKSFQIFKRNGAHLVEKRMFGKNKDCPLLKFECFEHVNFAINEKHFQKNNDNPK
jgi:hypothetical protein